MAADVVVSYASGYGASAFERYLRSLRATGYPGLIVIFVPAGQATEEIGRVTRRYGADIYSFPRPAQCLDSNIRFQLYRHYLGELPSASRGRVLHTDFRDVIFQSDPFEHPSVQTADLVLALERRSIGECEYNLAWTMGILGVEEALSTYAKQPIICSGTTLGSWQAFCAYLDRLLAMFHEPGADGRPKGLHPDQGLHNVIFHGGGVPPYRHAALSSDEGPFNTLGYEDHWEIRKGRVVNRRGEPSPVVHQFDRGGAEFLSALGNATGLPFDDLLSAP